MPSVGLASWWTPPSSSVAQQRQRSETWRRPPQRIEQRRNGSERSDGRSWPGSRSSKNGSHPRTRPAMRAAEHSSTVDPTVTSARPQGSRGIAPGLRSPPGDRASWCPPTRTPTRRSAGSVDEPEQAAGQPAISLRRARVSACSTSPTSARWTSSRSRASQYPIGTSGGSCSAARTSFNPCRRSPW